MRPPPPPPPSPPPPPRPPPPRPAPLVLLRRAHYEDLALDGQRLPETVSVHAARRRNDGDLRPTFRAAAEHMDAAGF